MSCHCHELWHTLPTPHFRSLSLKGRGVLKKKVSGRFLLWGFGIVSSMLRNNKGVFWHRMVNLLLYSKLKIKFIWNGTLFFVRKRNKYKEVHLLCSLEGIYFCLCGEDTRFSGSVFSWCSWLLFSYNSIVMSLIPHSLWILSCYLLSFTAT